MNPNRQEVVVQDEQVNILKCCGGHEDHFDHCIVFESGDDLFLDEEDMPWWSQPCSD